MTANGFIAGDVLLVVDVINDFKHDDGDRLLESFRERVTAMTAAIAAARRAACPVIYVNDDQGRWDSDAPGLVRAAIENGDAPDLIHELAPFEGAHFLLKHRYSAFDHTALDLLLDELDVERLILIGAATEGCIVQTAIDAREHGLKTTILADACATTDSELETIALRYATQVAGARVAWSSAKGAVEERTPAAAAASTSS
jgi:nicotinamidase-related amidase